VSDEQLENQEHDEDNFEAGKEPYQSLAAQLYVRFCQSVLRIPFGRPATVTFGPFQRVEISGSSMRVVVLPPSPRFWNDWGEQTELFKEFILARFDAARDEWVIEDGLDDSPVYHLVSFSTQAPNQKNSSL